jgi:hypothetical protein
MKNHQEGLDLGTVPRCIIIYGKNLINIGGNYHGIHASQQSKYVSG